MQLPNRTVIAAAIISALGVLAGEHLLWPLLSRGETAVPATPGPVDIGFAQSMALHHQQAIGMAQLMLDERPTPLVTLARSIAGAQLLELGEMRGWLRLWNAPLVAERQGMEWMRLGSRPLDETLQRYLLDCQRAPTGMVGLATDDELNRLRLLDGRARDKHFLTLMLAHHQGAIPMAQFAAAEGRVPAVRDLAGRIVLEQSEEIYRIQRTLAAIAALDAQAD
ncbi:MAG TPA: DUF305 domain-containing protein [Fontimonas sp.]